MEKSSDNDKLISAMRQHAADLFFADDIALSRLKPRGLLDETAPSDGDPRRTAEQLLHEVDEFLAENEVRSKEELQFLLAKIDSAMAINNNPKTKEMREDLIRKFGDDARE